jgi:excisionase family DNA binding protein
MELTFEQLPQAISRLLEKLENIEQLIVTQNSSLQPESDKLLTIKQAAEIIHLSVPTIYGLVQRSEVPVCKRGKRLYFSKQELTAWIMSGRKRTIAEIDEDVKNYYPSLKRGKKY